MTRKILFCVFASTLFLSACGGKPTYQYTPQPRESSSVEEGFMEVAPSEVSDSISDSSDFFNEAHIDMEDSVGELNAGVMPEIDQLSIPSFSGDATVDVNGNRPFLSKTAFSFGEEYYSELDELGRCGPAHACIGPELLPTEERGQIGHVKPAGWHTVKYPELISDLYLYNRCHLIAFELAAENDNPRNLITGTRYMNVSGMLPYENMVADYVRRTGKHVMYRVTPHFVGDELICRGVLIEACSAEDDGISFCVYCYNIQPGIEIDYMTGDSWIKEAKTQEINDGETTADVTYILNTGSRKFHTPDCEAILQMSDRNKKETNEIREVLIKNGYSPCGMCNP